MKFSEIFTGVDNKTLDIGRIAGAAGLITFLGLEIFVVLWRNIPFDMQTFGIAFGLMITAIGAGLKLKESTEPKSDITQKGAVDPYMLITGLALTALLFVGCSTASLIKDITHPIESQKADGSVQAVEEIQAPATMERKDVPVGVDPDDVIAHVQDNKTGEEVWVVQDNKVSKPKIYTKKASATAANPTPKNDLDVNVAKHSYKWVWIILAIAGAIAGMYFGDKAIVGFIGFNPIALVGSFLSTIVTKFITMLKPKVVAEVKRDEAKVQDSIKK